MMKLQRCVFIFWWFLCLQPCSVIWQDCGQCPLWGERRSQSPNTLNGLWWLYELPHCSHDTAYLHTGPNDCPLRSLIDLTVTDLNALYWLSRWFLSKQGSGASNFTKLFNRDATMYWVLALARNNNIVNNIGISIQYKWFSFFYFCLLYSIFCNYH